MKKFWNQFLKEKKLYIVSGMLFVIYLGMHYYKLSSIPFGLHVDEAGAGYDAWCLANWGVDRYLKEWPVYLVNFGGGQSALYAYLAIPFVKLFGLTVKAVRMPAFCMSVLTYFFGTLIVKESFGKKAVLPAQFLFVALPYFMMSARFALDCNLLLAMSTMSIFLLMHAVKKGRWYDYTFAGISWGISLYSYALSYLTIPVFFLLILSYLLHKRQIKWKHVIALGIPVGVLALPLMLTVYINQFQKAEIMFGPFTIPRLPDYRGSEIIFNNIYGNLTIVLQAILTKDWLPYNAFENFGTIYRISIPFLVIGFFIVFYKVIDSCAKEKCFTYLAFPFFWSISELITGCLIGGDGPNINKMNGIFFALLVFIVAGYLGIEHLLQSERIKDKKIPKVYRYGVLGYYCFLLLCFAGYYYKTYPEDIYPQFAFSDDYSDVLEREKDNLQKAERVYIDSRYIYYLFYSGLSPYEYQIAENGEKGWSNIVFSLPAELEENAVYVVRFYEFDYIDQLKKAGFQENKGYRYHFYYK